VRVVGSKGSGKKSLVVSRRERVASSDPCMNRGSIQLADNFVACSLTKVVLLATHFHQSAFLLPLSSSWHFGGYTVSIERVRICHDMM